VELTQTNSNSKIVLAIKVNHVELLVLKNLKIELKKESSTLFLQKILLLPTKQDAR